MYIRRSYQFRYICYSKVTDQAVWVYQGLSRQGMKRKYYRTVAEERKRKRQWAKRIKTCRNNLQHLLNECRAAMCILCTLTKEQREAIKTLQQMTDNPPEFGSPFLDHDRERRHQNYLAKHRNRNYKDEAFRKQERERIRKSKRIRRKETSVEIHDNHYYDK